MSSQTANRPTAIKVVAEFRTVTCGRRVHEDKQTQFLANREHLIEFGLVERCARGRAGDGDAFEAVLADSTAQILRRTCGLAESRCSEAAEQTRSQRHGVGGLSVKAAGEFHIRRPSSVRDHTWWRGDEL